MRIFRKERDFEAFGEVIGQAKMRRPMRVLAWCVLSNHWHFVLWPRGDGELSDFMRWLTVLRYVERNPLRANLVEAGDAWRWSSLWHRAHGNQAKLIGDGPLALPQRWRQTVQRPETEGELEALRRSVVRGAPFGDASWQTRTAKRLCLESTLRARGRPRKSDPMLIQDSRPLYPDLSSTLTDRDGAW